MIKSVTITFPVPVEFPDGWEHVLSTLVSMVCEKYQRDNPERVMWAAGHGSRPIMRMGEFGGFEVDAYSIDCEEREDLHGTNPANPRYFELRRAAAESCKADRQASKPV